MNGAKRHFWFVLMLLLVNSTVASAQKETEQPTGASTTARSTLISAAEQQKAATQQVMALQQDEIKQAEAKHEQLRQLVADGLVARIELAESERSLAALRSKLDATRQQVTDTYKVIAEIVAADELAKSQAATLSAKASTAPSKSLLTPTILRYGGSTNWSVANLSTVQAFFSSAFGRSLPTSAVGQSATHNRLGFDHRHAVDVPLHPDSAEGRALISFLQSKGIPFLAFRGAVAGVSTGPHIHIGRPSHRLA
jgi:hypothetical protein